MQKKIPITILTGFLGSGKTTLLNTILSGNHGLKIAVVENEFGATDIDHALIKTTSAEEIIEVSNGCMCCTVRKDWMDAIERLLNTKKDIDAIVIEASGASEPLPIAQSFLMNDMGGRVKLDSIICMIDALNYESLFAASAQIALEQLEFADFVVLNKTDLVDAEKIMFLETAVRRVNAFAPIIKTNFGKINLSLLLSTDRFSLTEDIQNGFEKDHTHHHTNLDTYTYHARGKMHLRELDEFFKDLDTNVYRVKGFIQIIERGDIWWLVQKAGARITIEEWHGEKPENGKLVFIGEDMQTSLIHKLLDVASDAPTSVLFM